MQSQANGRINIPVRTRSIADAAGLTIYQARAYLGRKAKRPSPTAALYRD
ncbi:FaeA/PapI family transcriptional regulator [Salmonella enterica subsp. enterica serovar Kentucky]|nr:FaeA/PapI family transcriptional regulator [Salmonella enterica subsp. enterica serovar Kentucky]